VVKAFKLMTYLEKITLKKTMGEILGSVGGIIDIL